MNDNASHPDRAETLFHAATQLPAAERAAYLEQACGGDAQLRRRVEQLLAASEQAGAFLEQPAAPAAGRTIQLNLPPDEKPGDRIGRYKILQKIGEGGCGVVYMAEQEAPVRRRVALKVIKLGMDTKQVIARFEAERQALAMMDHPNIAKVLDAGSTENGRPFFVMELVRGIRITDYCDQNKLSMEQRLELFVQVCNAIQHAHQKGIIHRDIKPSNMLVTLHDGVPVPKVIDFGIAKATQGRLTDQTLFTAFEQFIGTPAYMSPEQAEMSGLDVDTRSDIYALGVLLYELLTGRTPFDARELLESGLDELRRTIREREPERPSTRLGTMIQADLTAVAQRRQAEAPKLIHLLRGDLDWIVMKTLEKDRTRRYETANGLALDIQRYLNDEAVLARPPSTLYRFQKLVRRNRTLFAAVGAGVAALVIGLVLSLYLFVQERAARQRAVAAEHEQARMREEAELHALWGQKISQAGLYMTRGEFGKAEELVNEVPPHTTMVPIFSFLGMVHARSGDWLPAITNYEKVIQLAPTDPVAYLALAPVLVEVGDTNGYRRYRQAMLEHFGELTNVVSVDGTAIGPAAIAAECLLLPASTAELQKMDRLIDAGLVGGPGLEAAAEAQFIRAFANYRAGDYNQAFDRLGKIAPLASNEGWKARTMLQSLLAMTQYRLQAREAAALMLSNAIDTADSRLENIRTARVGDDWTDWLMARALLREAKALMPELIMRAKTPEEPAWKMALEKAGYKVNSTPEDDGTWGIYLDDQPISDLSPLRGVPVSRLSLVRTKVSDLSPLRGMPLRMLRVGVTSVSDLSPLKGMALESLQFSGTQVSDISVLDGMPLRDLKMTGCTNLTNVEVLDRLPALQTVILPPNAKKFEFLRNHRGLLRISFRFDTASKGPAQSAPEFWAEYDRTNAARAASAK
jgi:serine/threonine protein kinase